VGPWFLTTFAQASGLDHLDYVMLLPSVEQCVQQVAHRIGHGFTDEEATRNMHSEFAGAEIADRHVLRPPLGSVDQIKDMISMAADRGDLRYRIN
jgi:hypothetical protein